MRDSTDLIPMTFVRRTTMTVFLVFLATMLVFLLASYRAEIRLYSRGVFEHLEETSAVLASLPAVLEPAPATWLAEMEEGLAARSGVPHRVVLTDSEFTVTDAASRAAVGSDIRELYRLEPFGTSDLSRAGGQGEGSSWLVSSLPVGLKGTRLFLMRSNDEKPGILMRFVGLHVLHVGVTLVLFFVLLRFLGERFIRRPILLLAAHVRRIEAGEFETYSENDRDDEFGWLAERFTEMGTRLREAVRNQVRMEKLASAGAVAYRAGHECGAPLHDLRNQIAFLEASSAPDDEAVMRIVVSMKKDHRRLVDSIVGLQRLSRAEDDEQYAPPVAP